MKFRIPDATKALAAAPLLLTTAMSIDAHHSAAMFETSQAVTVSGRLLRFDKSNPHSYLYIEQETGHGTVEWAIEGPAPNRLERRGLDDIQIAPGDVIEACGYVLKEAAQQNRSDRARVLVAEVVQMPDGDARLWSDYGNRHCRDTGRYPLRER